MPSPRKLYKQGDSMVVSFPFYLMRDMGAEPKDYMLVKRISDKMLIFELNKAHEVARNGMAFYQAIPFTSLRKLYRQSNCLVCSLPRPMLEDINAELGDTFAIQWLSQGTLSAVLIKKSLREYQDARNYVRNRLPRAQDPLAPLSQHNPTGSE